MNNTQKSPIQYDIIGNQGFTFNSSTYNILNRDNTFWTTSIPLQSAEIELKFPAQILTQIDFSKFLNEKNKGKTLFSIILKKIVVQGLWKSLYSI